MGHERYVVCFLHSSVGFLQIFPLRAPFVYIVLATPCLKAPNKHKEDNRADNPRKEENEHALGDLRRT